MCQKSLKKTHLDPDTTLKNFFAEKKTNQKAKPKLVTSGALYASGKNSQEVF